MEHGMPPIAGWGMGMDRFLALLTSQENLKDTILFPLMRPIKEEKEEIQEVNLDELKLTKQEAMAIVKENLKQDHMISHSIASAAVMEELAPHFSQDPEKWYILGLLHDIDFEETADVPEKHGIITGEILKKHEVPESVIRIIQSHNEATGIKRELLVDYALAASETITGLIVATALVYPDRKIASVKPESVLKRMKKKDFARNVNRETIQEIEKTGLSLDEFIKIALEGMGKIADQIGL